ncbi:MAG: hypothetical protein Crog4KO_36380 [Crocinitomicaceae bacterium]
MVDGGLRQNDDPLVGEGLAIDNSVVKTPITDSGGTATLGATHAPPNFTLVVGALVQRVGTNARTEETLDSGATTGDVIASRSSGLPSYQEGIRGFAYFDNGP